MIVDSPLDPSEKAFTLGEGKKRMADEIKSDTIADVEETVAPADIVAPKKRGPRQKKVASEAIAETAEATVAPAAKRGRKAKQTPTDATTAAQPQAATRSRRKSATGAAPKARGPKPAVDAPAPISNEIADLVQLEEENARLRKALGEKLRAENADLRKRLGLA